MKWEEIKYLVNQGTGHLKPDDKPDAERDIVKAGTTRLLIVLLFPDHREGRKTSDA
jgi:hypothetical protein